MVGGGNSRLHFVKFPERFNKNLKQSVAKDQPRLVIPLCYDRVRGYYLYFLVLNARVVRSAYSFSSQGNTYDSSGSVNLV